VHLNRSNLKAALADFSWTLLIIYKLLLRMVQSNLIESPTESNGGYKLMAKRNK
jgi:DNA-binding IscR family transcriptional regulator